jgi:hypothetical protein
MKRFVYALGLLAGLLLVVGLLAACGGDDDDAEPTEAATATAEAPEAGRTDEPDVIATEPTEADPTPEPGAESAFDSFHYTVDLAFTVAEPGEGEESLVSGLVEGDFVAPDSHSFSTTFGFAGLSATQELVIIGDSAWMREGSGDWVDTSASDPDVLDALDLTSADPTFFQDSEFAEDLARLDSEPDTINGVETRRYFISREAIETLAALLGDDFLGDTSGIEEFEMTVWLEEETDALVRAELTATASPDLLAEGAPFALSPDAEVTISMMIDVTQINDPDIEIEPPG